MRGNRKKSCSQPCQGWGRGFESLRPLQEINTLAILIEWLPLLSNHIATRSAPLYALLALGAPPSELNGSGTVVEVLSQRSL
jgi:hypothetical protein